MNAWRRRVAELPARELPGGLVLHTAGGPLARLRGLARLNGLPSDRGLLLTRTRSVHTLGMRFALDLVWLDRRGAVVRVDRAVAPRRHASCRGARAVVEVRAGMGDRFATALASQVPVQRTRPSV
ncbi:MAG: DUF192 domain-containing protein [Solirubrobacteraceae bacterium]|nr:DUF192 domain-containing protein [Solirubrobacteraceae bacterium]